MKVVPRYSCIFMDRYCPRNCSYCLAKKVRGKEPVLKPKQWAKALHILEDHGVKFHVILGNELLTYQHDPIELVKELKPFWERYGMYSTFPEPWASKLMDKILDVGIYNLSGGVDVWPGLKTGDKNVDNKANSVLQWLLYAKEKGVPDIQVQITIHRHNYNKLEPLLNLCTKKGLWVGCSLIEYSADGKHDFYPTKDKMENWLIPNEEKEQFRDSMFSLAEKVQSGRWMMQLPPDYFRELGIRELENKPWHCSRPILIHLEEDGALRACSYRGPLEERHTIFEFESGSFTMDDYIRLQRNVTKKCPGCSGGGGIWSYWWMAEHWLKGEVEVGDKVFQVHKPGYEFDKTIKNK
jgi:MoaA/NifB/PqqE/SkfB family radical SAM enzyme